MRDGFRSVRIAALSVALSVLASLAGAAQAPATPAATELTAVQLNFINHRPLTLLDLTPDAPADAHSSLLTPPPLATAKPAAADFTPARRSKVFFYAFKLIVYEHLVRVATEQKSRTELQGPFFQDWFDSVHVPRKWGDKDPWQLNYIGHAIHGSAAARIWLDQRERPTTTRQYLQGMGRALVFTTIFSELFENGPISESSIGNVARSRQLTGWVDHVWTPVGGVLWAMGEDAIDRYVIVQVDRHVKYAAVRAAARMALNPGRMLANLAENRLPWYRMDRPFAFGTTAGR